LIVHQPDMAQLGGVRPEHPQGAAEHLRGEYQRLAPRIVSQYAKMVNTAPAGGQ